MSVGARLGIEAAIKPSLVLEPVETNTRSTADTRLLQGNVSLAALRSGESARLLAFSRD